jgi:hypothetical protein
VISMAFGISVAEVPGATAVVIPFCWCDVTNILRILLFGIITVPAYRLHKQIRS